MYIDVRAISLRRQLAAGLFGELVGGVLGLVIGAVIGGNMYGPGQTMEIMSEGVATDTSTASDSAMAFAGMYGYEATGWVGIIVGIIVGGVTGVWWAGRRRGVHGSFVATLMGSLLAVLLCAGILVAAGGGAGGDWLFNKERLTLPFLLLATPLGATLGFMVTGRIPGRTGPHD